MVLAGCSGNHEPPPAADAAAARAALVAALDAWQAGRTPKDLQMAATPIMVADEDWQAGRKLAGYELLAGELPAGSSIRWPVRLRLDANGREEAVEATYAVATSPSIHISRAD